MNEDIKKYYCKKSYNDFLVGNYYDKTVDNYFYTIVGKTKNNLEVKVLYNKFSNMYINFNKHFILATIHDRKTKIKKLKNEGSKI